VERAANRQDDWTLLRVEIPDRPGGFALLARCLAACGVDILATEVLAHRSDAALADVLVSGGDLDRALRALDEDVSLRGRRNHGNLPDPGLAMAVACRAVATTPGLEGLLNACASLVGATTGAIYPVVSGVLGDGIEHTAGLRDLAVAALAERGITTSDTPAGSAVALATGEPPRLVITLARDHVFPFADAETDRLLVLAEFASTITLQRDPPTTDL
jgi:hypothetical protein